MKVDVEAVPRVADEASPAGEGFVLEEVEMRGFMRYLERTDPPLRFPEKYTVITGRTGAGKSTILDAITFALYGQTARTDIQSVKLADVCRPGGYVRVAFRQGDSRWEVKRGFTSRKDSYLEVSRHGEAVTGTIPEKEATIRDVVGLDYVGFRNSTFVRQEEMKELGAQRGADRLAVFQKLFRLEAFERALEIAKEQQIALQADARAKEAEIAARREALERLPGLRDRLAGLQTDLAARNAKVTELARRMDQAEVRLRALQEVHETYVRAVAARDERAARFASLAKRIEDTREKGKAFVELEARRAALETESKDLDSLREELERLKERADARERLEIAAQAATKLFDQAKRDHERRRDQIKDRIDALHRKIAALPTDLNREAAFHLLRDEGRFEERVERIGRELEWVVGRESLVRELALERARAEKALDHIRAKVGSINEDVFVLSELETQIGDLKDELRQEADESHRTLRPLDDDKVAALRALDGAPFGETDRTRLQDLVVSVQAKAAGRTQAEELRARLAGLGDPTSLIRDLEAQRAALEEEGRRAEPDIERLRAGEAEFGGVREGVDGLRKTLEEGRKALHLAQGEAGQLARQIGDLEADAAKLTESERQLGEIRVGMEVVDLLVSRVFHKRGVVMYAVDQLLPELEIEASKNLAELTDGRFSRIKLETYEEGRGHGIRILVQGVDALWHDVGEFSGGEKTQINAALRFAIAKALASLPQAGRAYGRMKTLFIDEGDLGSLDTEVSRELFVQKLFRMGAFFEKVILITHLAEVADRFPGRIRVTMTPNQESRVDVLA